MKNILIIGAGIAGLAAARELTRKGHQVTVLDKGRGLGGRMATRRLGEARCDHGAQYFSAKTPDFQQVVKEAEQAGAVAPWRPAHLQDAHPRWVGSSGMTALPKFLAQNLDVRRQHRVVRLSANDSSWTVLTGQGQNFVADAVIVTIPAPQALQLLTDSDLNLPATEQVLRSIDYHPCLAVLATLDRPSGMPAPGSFQSDDHSIAWLTDNQQKGISAKPSITIHASPVFSRQHLDGNPDAAAQELLDLAQPKIKPAKVKDWQIHRWRYSLAYHRHVQPYHAAETPCPLLFGGDGFGIGNVEGAFLSGRILSGEF